ncbi:unnamed protein product [Haemonchus placei]|uniref:Uncharacterized protein n=1 Tax=Haemonchus placei TaxID=6290 RepID=A0A3P7VIW4_HAEPC|nr:unnamed protein product [Haemonchus placei]
MCGKTCTIFYTEPSEQSFQSRRRRFQFFRQQDSIRAASSSNNSFYREAFFRCRVQLGL